MADTADTIVSLLQQAAAAFGNRPAVIARQGYRTERWTYACLWALSGHTAAFLQRRGIHKGDRAILWAPNSPQWVAAYFGCLRTGAIVVPLDVRSSPEFVRKVVERTQPRLAFLSAATASSSFEEAGVPVVHLEGLETLAQEDTGYQEVPLAPSDIAEVMFTSGTTGDPKGVILTHGNIAANVRAATQAVPSKPTYRLLSLLPLSHMLEQTVGLLAPLSGGASIYYPQGRQPTLILRALREYRITTLVLVPQALQLFMNAIEGRVREQGKDRAWRMLHRVAPHLPFPLRRRLFAPVHRQLGGALRFVMCGGAYLDPALAQQWEDLGIVVLQGYGTTEAAPIISCNTFQRRKLDSVGMPLPGVRVRTASDGEILVRGGNVTPGYWQDPRATHEAFEDGWYRTGDLGCQDADGFLYFKGRKKDLIVLASGLNVYPEDIEALLKKHPDVADAAVVGLPRQGQDIQVHAVLLMRDGKADARAAVEAANGALADHQRIQGATVWPEVDFPRTHTLKVKKHQVLEQLLRLKAGTKPTAPVGADQAAPATPLAQLLSRLLQVPAGQLQPAMRLGSELGMDSLGRVELLAAVETEMGVYLDESQVSADTTLEELEVQVAQVGQVAQRPRYWQWPLHPLARLGRASAQALLAFPVLRLLAPVRVQGAEHLKGLQGPVLFAANHLSHLDTPAVLAALPARWRSRTAVAAAADVWFGKERWKAVAAAFLFNAFPFSRTGSVRPSLEHCSRLLDKGWSVLIYPEGTRSISGRIGPFKSGTGLMAVEMGVSVVPVHVQGTYEVLSKDQTVPRRGRVQVCFGKPLQFSRKTSYIEATRAVEAAMRALEAEPGRQPADLRVGTTPATWPRRHR
ncbi:MAG: AMP-binding protein [Chloroflexi bacterium]|nr:AMP-binding protein [Chloroflexota bacterium]